MKNVEITFSGTRFIVGKSVSTISSSVNPNTSFTLVVQHGLKVIPKQVFAQIGPRGQVAGAVLLGATQNYTSATFDLYLYNIAGFALSPGATIEVNWMAVI